MTNRTKSSTYGERRFAAGSELTLLDELDAVIEKRKHAEGELGNLKGALATAQLAVINKGTEVDNLEKRAARLRTAYEHLRGTFSIEDDTDNGPSETDIAIARATPGFDSEPVTGDIPVGINPTPTVFSNG